jgi:hypothetical protein
MNLRIGLNVCRACIATSLWPLHFTSVFCATDTDSQMFILQAEAKAIAGNASALGPQKVDAILGFNEPNAGADGPRITVADAVTAWKTWFEPIAAERNATHLVTPSTAHCACDGVNCSGGGGANSPTGCECQVATQWGVCSLCCMRVACSCVSFA